MRGVQAYRKLGLTNGPGQYVIPCRWLKRVNILNRIMELQKQSEQRSLLTMQERRDFLARVVRADMAKFDASKDGDLIQEITEEVVSDHEGETKTIRKVKLPGKRECVLDDAKLAGELIDKQDLTSNGQTLVPQVTVVLQPHWRSIRGQEQVEQPERIEPGSALPEADPPQQ